MTIATIIDAALRPLLLAFLVWSGLRIFRVRSFHAQRDSVGRRSRRRVAHAGCAPVFCPLARPAF